jgi:hypothetical protein
MNNIMFKDLPDNIQLIAFNRHLESKEHKPYFMQFSEAITAYLHEMFKFKDTPEGEDYWNNFLTNKI